MQQGKEACEQGNKINNLRREGGRQTPAQRQALEKKIRTSPGVKHKRMIKKIRSKKERNRGGPTKGIGGFANWTDLKNPELKGGGGGPIRLVVESHSPPFKERKYLKS